MNENVFFTKISLWQFLSLLEWLTGWLYATAGGTGTGSDDGSATININNTSVRENTDKYKQAHKIDTCCESFSIIYGLCLPMLFLSWAQALRCENVRFGIRLIVIYANNNANEQRRCCRWVNNDDIWIWCKSKMPKWPHQTWIIEILHKTWAIPQKYTGKTVIVSPIRKKEMPHSQTHHIPSDVLKTISKIKIFNSCCHLLLMRLISSESQLSSAQRNAA